MGWVCLGQFSASEAAAAEAFDSAARRSANAYGGAHVAEVAAVAYSVAGAWVDTISAVRFMDRESAKRWYIEETQDAVQRAWVDPAHVSVVLVEDVDQVSDNW